MGCYFVNVLEKNTMKKIALLVLSALFIAPMASSFAADEKKKEATEEVAPDSENTENAEASAEEKK